VVRLQPEYLVLADAHPEEAARQFESLASLPGWRILDAVRKHHFAVMSDAVNRPGPRIAAAIEELARQLHPDAFSETPAGAKEAPGRQDLAAPPKKEAFSVLLDSTCSSPSGAPCAR